MTHDPMTKRQQRVKSIFSPPATAVSEDMAPWRIEVHRIIFGAETRIGRLFDLALLWLILISVTAVILETVPSINVRWGLALRAIEWTVTIVFSIEYILRIICVRRPLGYVTSFFGVVDLLSVIPTYLSLFVAGTQALAVIRVLRVMRVFRLLKLPQFVEEAEALFQALAASIRKITIFFASVLMLVVIMGSVVYLIEGDQAGFDSIPRSIYWAIVTLTTVGYGDIAPKTPLGQFVAAGIMILGYSIIAVPTGVVSVELARAVRAQKPTAWRACAQCGSSEHDEDAAFCKHCGADLTVGR